MSQIGTMLTGAGVVTVIAGQSQCESMLVIGDVDDTFALQGVQVEIDGVPFLNIANQAVLLAAYAKWMGLASGGAATYALPSILKLATGRINRNTTYRLTNNGATTPNVYAYSDASNGVPLLVGVKQVNATSYEDFVKFSALLLSVPANINNCEIVFADGTRSTMTIFEVQALFAMKYPSEATGMIGGVLVIDNRDQSIQSVRVNTLATAVNVLITKIPDAAFAVLNS